MLRLFYIIANKQTEFETANRIGHIVFQKVKFQKVKSPRLVEVFDFDGFTENDKQFQFNWRKKNVQFSKYLYSWICTRQFKVVWKRWSYGLHWQISLIFIKDTDGHLKKIQVINFDTIHKQTRSEKIDENLLKEYRTDDNWRISFYPEKEEKALSSAFRCPRKDFFTKETVNALFKKMADKIVVEEFDICHKFVDGLIYDSEHINYLISHNLVFDFIEYNDFKLNLLIN